MRLRPGLLPVMAVVALAGLVCSAVGCLKAPENTKTKSLRSIVTSDSILSGMVASILPPHLYSVESILPPGQCPGHYDVKLSDIENMRKADLIVSFKGMPYMNNTGGNGSELLVDAQGRNWMAPDSYLHGLSLLAGWLSDRYPEDKDKIAARKEESTGQVRSEINLLKKRISLAGILGKAVIASSMQKETLEWMGFRVVAQYGRPEGMSAKEIVRLAKLGKQLHVVLVVDNLQSGPDTGTGIAEALHVPHVVLTNFPADSGYLATMKSNADTILAATAQRSGALAGKSP